MPQHKNRKLAELHSKADAVKAELILIQNKDVTVGLYNEDNYNPFMAAHKIMEHNQLTEQINQLTDDIIEAE